MTDVKSLIEGAMEETVRQMVGKVIRESVGYGIDSEIKQVIKAKAEKIIP